MNRNENQEIVRANLASVISSLTELTNNWDDDTQQLFDDQFSGWAIPSLDEVVADFSHFLEFLNHEFCSNLS